MRCTPPRHIGTPRGPGRPAAFTLVELLVAVGLLALLIVMAAFIFQTSMSAIGTSQASNELSMRLGSFTKVIYDDLKGIETNGFLIIGRRQQDAYGSAEDRAVQRKQTFRTDWLEFMCVSERYSAMDPRLIGQWSRILYGHGRATDPSPTNSSYDNVATSWILMRHQVLEVAHLRGVQGVQALRDSWSGYGGSRAYIDMEDAGAWIGDYSSGSGVYTYPFTDHLKKYADRRFYWSWYWNWRGDPILQINEPTNYFSYLKGSYQESRARYAMAHCADFRVQYAMDTDIVDGVVTWHDPPAVNDNDNPGDPNYNDQDPLHDDPKNLDGRLVFGPGDRWPKLLRITARSFDPIGRLEGGRAAVVIVNIP